MSNKMLIDATHPEETRVAVVRGNRIEEFDFESQEKRQLRGNIYLAKVTRVEPSLQAAFIDYGGNRHGFLAFSEIHPDYYQIPVADRQALLEAEAAEARASREADEAEDNDSEENDEVTAEAEEKPAKKPKRPRRSRKSKKASENGDESQDSETADNTVENAGKQAEADAPSEDDGVESNADAEQEAAPEADEEAEKPKKPRRRTSRKKAPAKAKDADTETQEEDSGENPDEDNPTIMSAIVETDEISEPLPENEDGDEENGDSSSDEAGEPEEVAEKKPKRRASRPRKRKTTEAKEEAASEEPAETKDAIAEDASETGSEEEVPTEASSESDGEAEASDKPKRRSSRRKPSRKKKAAQEEAAEEAKADDDEQPDEDVESVGQEDALEEVPVPRRARKHYKIQEVIKRRQVLLVQVVKEERGTKGAALTTYLSLAGRYSVLMPNTARGGGISRKITNSADRKRLKSIAAELEVPEGMGVILRTAGAARTKDEINRDFEYLMRLWEQVRTLTLSSTAPCLVYEEGSLIKRSIRDLYDKDTGEILVAGEAGFQEAKDFMGMLLPGHVRKVKQYKGTQAIFAKNGVESQLDKMVSPQVTLKSGGYLVINQTEALVAVDVNSGRSTREHSVEDTALQTNLEAAEEVARQLRLRDLAGLIVIDFIDMEERRNNRAVEKKLKDCLKNDRARIQVGRISHFGLMEMSRQRMRASVLESTMDVCEHCAGTGYVRSESAIALHVFRAIEEHVARHNKFDCIVKTTPSIAINILNHKRQSLIELERKYGLQVLVEGDPEISGQEFKIEKGEHARGDTGPSPIGFQNDAASEVYDQDTQEDGENEGRRKRGRRRGRKAKNEETSQEPTEAQETAQDADNDATPSGDGDGEGAKKKRTRGKRGGRKNKSDQELSDSQSDATDAKEEPAPNGETANATEAESEPEKPKSRSTVRRKAPVAPKTEEPEQPAPEASSEPQTPPPPRKPRRTTRRKATDGADGVAEADPQPAAQEATESNASPTISEAVEGDDGSKKKKSGWWNRGFFQ